MSTTLETDERIPFKKPNIIYILLGCFLLLFFGGILINTFINFLPNDVNANSNSYSCIGHRAFIEILKKCGFNVQLSHQYIHPYVKKTTILFLEPNLHKWNEYTHQPLGLSIDKMLNKGKTVIIVCPKWRARGIHKKNKSWLKDYVLITDFAVNNFLSMLNTSLEIVRLNKKSSKISIYGQNKLWQIHSNSIQVFKKNSLYTSFATTVDGHPFIYSLRINRGELIIVSDPGIFNNMNIGKVDNGLFMLELLKRTAPNKNLLIDEIAHGFGAPPSILKALLTYPALCITLHSIVIAIFIAWSTGKRFYAPLPSPKRNRSLEEQIKAFAGITCSSKKHSYFLQKYIKYIIQEVEEHYPCLLTLKFNEKLDYLEEIGKIRKNPYSIRELYIKSKKNKTGSNVNAMAKRIYKWKKQMIS